MIFEKDRAKLISPEGEGKSRLKPKIVFYFSFRLISQYMTSRWEIFQAITLLIVSRPPGKVHIILSIYFGKVQVTNALSRSIWYIQSYLGKF